jgi:hypothetical protein
MRVGACLGDVAGDVELEAQRVLARLHLAGHVDVVAHEHVLRLRATLPLRNDGCEGVDVLERQRQVAVDVGGGSGEGALHDPGGLVDPHDLLLV